MPVRQLAPFPPGLRLCLACRPQHGYDQWTISVAAAESAAGRSTADSNAVRGHRPEGPVTVDVTRWLLDSAVQAGDLPSLIVAAGAFRTWAVDHPDEPSTSRYLPLYALLRASPLDAGALAWIRRFISRERARSLTEFRWAVLRRAKHADRRRERP